MRRTNVGVDARPGTTDSSEAGASAWTGQRGDFATSIGRGQGHPRRSWGLIALAALLVLGTGLAVAAWGLHAGDRVSVVAVAADVRKGETIDRADLTTSSVAVVPQAIPVTEIDAVVGEVAATDLVAGQVLNSQMISDSALPPAGRASVGLALDADRTPSGLAPGDLVDVIAVAAAQDGVAGGAGPDEPLVLAADSEVLMADDRATVDGQQTLTVLVDADQAARVASYSAQGMVAVIEVSLQDLATTPTGGPR